MTEPICELRSDTFTRPTKAMRRAMYDAEVGDDVWNEDPTVRRLEERAAELTGKAAAVFVSSGTQGNLIGLLAHTRPGDEVILGDQSHIFWYEVGGTAVVGGLQLRTLPNRRDGRLMPDEVAGAIRLPPDEHFPRTGCVAVEDTHNRCGGAVIPASEIAEVSEVAHAAKVPVHMDGARIFNAASALGVPVARLTESVDSVTFCLSKGLGAPVGSLLCGATEFVERSHRWRKLLGGGMRQVGVLAAPGLVALDQQTERLADDHDNAMALANGLAEIQGVEIELASVQSNIVVFDLVELIDPDVFLARAAERGVLLGRLAGAARSVRAVTSYEIDRTGIDRALTALASALREFAPALV